VQISRAIQSNRHSLGIAIHPTQHSTNHSLLNMATASSSSSSAKRIKIGTTSNASLDDVPVDVFINYIIPLIGDYPYCFVAIGIPNFRDAYVTMFPDETTYIEFATVKDAKMYCDKKLHDATTNQCMLCKKVTQKGNLTVLMYLRSIGCSWDEWTCAHAAENGHLDVLQWCIQNGCPWDRYTCAFAAKNGHGRHSLAGIGSPMVVTTTTNRCPK
jgi:hypothetical protein